MEILNKIVEQGKLSFGLVFPLESYSGSIPKMENQEILSQLAESLGFKSLWFRDVPFHDPSFGDAGQMFDPWVYMTHIMNHTKTMILGTGSIILPLRHPVHTLKSINSLQVLSKGRIVVGAASGDRPIEYPAFNRDLSQKGELYRESFNYMKALQGNFPKFESQNFGAVQGQVDLLPKTEYQTPFLVTGHSGQSMEWIAQNGDGWLYYPRNISILKESMRKWTMALSETGATWKPYMQSLYIDLLEDDDAPPQGIHLGFKSGSSFLLRFLKEIEEIGVNHVVFNLKFASLPVTQVLNILAKKILKEF